MHGSFDERARPRRSSRPKSKPAPGNSVCGRLARSSRGESHRPSCGSWAGEVLDKNRIELFKQRLTRQGYFANPALRKSGAERGQPSITIGRGKARIYILSIAQNECFLSAQTMQGRQIWYSTFHDPIPIGSVPGDWTIEESEDRKQVVPTWSGSGMNYRIHFDATTGDLVENEVF
jgi:hypothetical protein